MAKKVKVSFGSLKKDSYFSVVSKKGSRTNLCYQKLEADIYLSLELKTEIGGVGK